MIYMFYLNVIQVSVVLFVHDIIFGIEILKKCLLNIKTIFNKIVLVSFLLNVTFYPLFYKCNTWKKKDVGI